MKTEKILDIVISAGALTFFAYESTYFYYYGHFGYYGIPVELIHISVDMVIRFIGSLFIYVGILGTVIIGIFAMIPKPKSDTFFIYLKIDIIWILLLMFDFYIYGMTHFKINVVCTVLLLLLQIYVFVKHKKEKSSGEENTCENNNNKIVLADMLPRLVTTISAILFLFFLVQTVFMLIGARDALNKKEYYKLGNSSIELILEESGDFFVVGEYDEFHKKFNNKFSLISKEGQTIEKWILER